MISGVRQEQDIYVRLIDSVTKQVSHITVTMLFEIVRILRLEEKVVVLRRHNLLSKLDEGFELITFSRANLGAHCQVSSELLSKVQNLKWNQYILTAFSEKSLFMKLLSQDQP